MTDQSTASQQPPSELSRVARGGAITLAGAVVSGAATFLLTVVLTRGLSQESAGVFFSVTSVFVVAASLSQLGSDTGLVYFVARARARGEVEQAPWFVRAATWPVALCGLVVGALLYLLATPLGSVTNSDHPEMAADFLRAIALFVPLVGLEAIALAATRGMGTMRPYAVVEQVGRPSLQLFLVALVLWFDWPSWVALAWAACYLPAAIAAWFWWRSLPVSRVVYSGDHPVVARAFWRFTAPRSVASVAQLLMQRLDIVLVAAIAGAVEAAIYTAATRFIVAGQMGRQAISFAVQPAFASALADRDKGRAHELFSVTTGWLMIVTWPMFVTFAVAAEDLLPIFGGDYASGEAVLVVLALAMLIATACGDVDNLLIMAGKTSLSLYNMLLALVVCVGLDLLLIPEMGMLGAAIGWGSAMVIKNTVALWQVWRLLRMHPFGRPSALVALASWTAYGGILGGLLAIPAVAGRGLVGVVAVGVLACVVYAGLLWFMRGPLRLDSLRRRPAGPGVRR